MLSFQRFLCSLGAALVVVGFTSACGGSRSSALPGLPGSTQSAGAIARAQATGTVASADVVAINAGGGAVGSFSADKDYGSGTFTYSTTSTIDTSGVTNPPPAAVFQDERDGGTVAYTIPGLTPGATYTVRLDFAELFWTAPGQRVFNVSINNVKVLSNFDIFARAGARFKAITESFSTTASSSGAIAITLSAVTNNAAIQGIEIAAGGTSSPPPPGSVAINSGGGASGDFAADEDFVAAGTATATTSAAINTAGMSDPPPQAVLQSVRYGSTVAYTISGLTAGAAYTVRLDFVEIYFTSAHQRVFNVSINNAKVLTNFDIFASAGAVDKAVAESFNATASSSGTIAITLQASVNYAAISGIEISPAPVATNTFNDYVTFGYDNARDVFNPNSTAITPASLANLHLAWQAALGGDDFNTQTQPVLATEIPGHKGVLFVGGGSGNVYGYDALSGDLLWTRATGQETYTCENSKTIYFGVGGTVAYDVPSRSIYVVGNANASPNATATNSLFHLDGATGTILGQVDFAPPLSGWHSLDFSHTSVTLGGNGLAYVGTGATCDISSWRGRIVAINVPAMTLANTLFTVWNGTTQPWGGGGIWGWGGVSIDADGNVLSGVGNTDDGSTTHGSIVPPFKAAPHEYSGLGEAFIKVSPNLATVDASQHPIPATAYSGNSVDLDLQGTPVVFAPNGSGCDPMAALQAKSGTLYLYDTTRIATGLLKQYQLAPSAYTDSFLGGPAYSPATGLLYAAVPSGTGSLFAPGMIAIDPGCGMPSVTWHSSFGPNSNGGTARSVPAVSAGGVVFVGTPCSPDGNGSCTGGVTSSVASTAQNAQRFPAICCAPSGPGDGALWAVNASTGAVLNDGKPLIYTSGPLRVPPTIDGEWIFVLDNNGTMYGLTIDPAYPAIAAKARAIDSRMLRQWEAPPGH